MDPFTQLVGPIRCATQLQKRTGTPPPRGGARAMLKVRVEYKHYIYGEEAWHLVEYLVLVDWDLNFPPS